MLTIYKASAGSGKTFRLVVEYLKLLLKNEFNYRHILAVTFTNKATAEMKERVIEQLNLMASGEKSGYLDILVRETGSDEAGIREKAARILQNILFDYNRFSISTIDKFTQKMIKSFNREAGITPDFELELDNELVVSESVDRLISTIDSNIPLQNWLEDFIDEKIRDNRNFSIEKDLKNLGAELFRENLQGKIKDLQAFFEDPDRKKQYLGTLNKIIFSFESGIFSMAGKMVVLYRNQGYSVDDFSNKTRGIAGWLEKISRRVMPAEISKTAYAAAESEDKWVTRAHPRRAELSALVSSDLMPELNRLIAFFNEKSQSYHTARAIKAEWYTLAVLLDLNREISALGREKGILPIAGSNLLLKAIIDGNDTPFIYERTGNIYQHFMLDEFQDTSVMQWENFRPLIANALGSGSDNLAVGDVKQSIYRWRNSDWSILANRVFSDFPGFELKEVALGMNYRSKERIISFNNLFFKTFVNQVASSEKLSPVIGHYRPVLDSIYGDLEQKPSGAGSGEGYVKISFFEDDDEGFRAKSLSSLVEQVKILQDKGMEAGDMAIIVRTNAQGEEIVNFFLEQSGLPENQGYNLSVLSNESLFLRNSPAVGFVMNMIRHLVNRDEKLTKATLLHLSEGLNGQHNYLNKWYEHSDVDSLFEERLSPGIREIEQKMLTSSIDEIIIRICHQFGLFENAEAIPFLQALIDKTGSIKRKMTNDLTNFLVWWEENGQKESVQINEKTNAVRLLTIHKSKGLEFRAVLVPFPDWRMSDGKNNILWCVPDKAPFDMAPLVPVAFRENLTGTIFAAEYYHEYFNQLVDNINLCYVAFTRAREVLVIHAPQTASANTVGYHLVETVRQMTGDKLYDPAWNEGEQFLESGKLPEDKRQQVQEEIDRKPVWHFNPFEDRLRLRSENNEPLPDVTRENTPKTSGKLIHDLLAEIKVGEDARPALERFRLRGIASPDTYREIYDTILKMTGNSQAKHWFDGTYRVYNETNLIAGGKLYRPDRMMLANDEAVIVDFKSGTVRDEAYKAQITRYCEILKETGMDRVSGYLWYIQTNEIDRVV